MNRIILAFAPENAVLADSIDRQLSRIGIPFERIHTDLARQITAAGEPVLLLVTDNLLLNRNCLEGLLPVIQGLATETRLLAVIADGVNFEGQAVETHIDRMANALHYMKHWQDTWLSLSDEYQQASGAEKEAKMAEADTARGIADEMGDLISTLREAGYLTWEQFEANDFAAFFQKFGLQDWHGQYKRLAAQVVEKQELTDFSHLPEMPVQGGVLSPEPVQEAPTAIEPVPEPEIPTPSLEAMDTLLEAMEAETLAPIPVIPTLETISAEQEATRDAWFWLEKGHIQRGFELFQMALEHYPESEWLRSEYEKASAQYAAASTEPLPEKPIPSLVPEPQTQSEEAKSYDLMGDMAAERGDYLFAKYCWDRVAEMDPNFPDLYRKLGLMTAEHLRDYRETAVIYLNKALEINPNDAELKAALDGLNDSNIHHSGPEIILENQAIVPVMAPEIPQEAPVITPQVVPEIPSPVVVPQPVMPKANGPLVLITGATSGIGRATAEIFAQNGYRLILTGRRVDRLVELKSRFEAEYGVEILLLPFDVRDPGAVEAALANLPDAFQEIDILVNNAGLAKGLAPIHEGNLEHWETMIDTNVKGLLYVTRLISPGMVKRRRGHIINVGSSAGKEAYPNGNVYCATKFAVDALTKSMRFDLHAHNIRVSQVSPGHVEETEFAITRFDGDAERAKIYNDFQPLKSSDVAEAIYFMATRPPHVNIQDIQLFATQQASSMVVNRSGRGEL